MVGCLFSTSTSLSSKSADIRFTFPLTAYKLRSQLKNHLGIICMYKIGQTIELSPNAEALIIDRTTTAVTLERTFTSQVTVPLDELTAALVEPPELLYGVGFNSGGQHLTNNPTTGQPTPAFTAWEQMLRRSDELVQFKLYKFAGFAVAQIWHDFQNFADWFVVHWKKAHSFWPTLNAETGQKVYSPTTVRWTPSQEGIPADILVATRQLV